MTEHPGPRALTTEPPAWGMEGCPLLPVEWATRLQPIRLDVTARAGAPRPEAAQLTGTLPFESIAWSRPPMDVALDVARRLFQAGGVPEVLEETVRGRPPLDASADDLDRLPLLATTRRELAATGMSTADAIGLIDAGHPARLIEVLGRLDAFLDLLLTPLCWFGRWSDDPYADWRPESAERRLMLASISEPDDLEGAVLLAQHRHVLMGGGSGRYADPTGDWVRALGARIGLSLEPDTTLESAGDLIGVTRERVRQVTKLIAIDHSHHRTWPLPPPLRPLHDILMDRRGASLAEVGPALAPLVPNAVAERLKPTTLTTRVITILRAYGLDIPTPAADGRTHLFEAPVTLPPGWSSGRARTVAWRATAGTGLARLDELRAALRAEDPDLQDEQLELLVTRGVEVADLPLGYYLRGSAGRPPYPVSTARRILGALGPLDIDELCIGLQRRFAQRRLGLLPPSEVIMAALASQPGFVIQGRTIDHDPRQPYDPDTVTGWILQQLRESPHGVLHRLVILDRTRAAGVNRSSASVYLTFGELFVSAGNGSGCITLLGTSVTAEAIEEARAEAAFLRIPSDVSIRNLEDGIRLDITVGTDLLNSGVLSIGKATAMRIGDRKLEVRVDGHRHGTMATSDSLLYGFSGGLTAVGAEVGGAVRVDLRLADGIVTFERKDPES